MRITSISGDSGFQAGGNGQIQSLLNDYLNHPTPATYDALSASLDKFNNPAAVKLREDLSAYNSNWQDANALQSALLQPGLTPKEKNQLEKALEAARSTLKNLEPDMEKAAANLP